MKIDLTQRWQVIHADCLQVLRELPDGCVDAILADPPYGIDLDTDFGCKNQNSNSHRPVAGDSKPFDPSAMLALDVPTIIWGGNNFASSLPDRGAWIVWDKVTRNGLNVRISECELAWTNVLARTRCIRHMWSGAFRDSERGTAWHPCQKPVEVMKWCLSFLPEGCTVLDPFCGSGTTGVACMQTGRRFIGIEIDAGYCDIARKRIADAATSLFDPPPPKPAPAPGLF